MTTAFVDRLRQLNLSSYQDIAVQVFSATGLRWSIRVVEVALALVLMQQLAALTWQFIAPDNVQVVHESSAAGGSASKKQTDLYTGLDNLHLFGREVVKIQQSEINVSDVPKSRLNARVTGVVASSNPALSAAVILSGDKEKMYRTGERLVGSSAEIKAIYSDRVIILNRGKEEALLLYPDKPSTPIVQDNSTDLKKLRQQVIENPASISDLVTFSAESRDGQLLGYRLRPGKNRTLFDQSGLKQGDIAVSVNGYDLGNQQNMVTLLKEVSAADALAITVDRGGQLYEIEIGM